MGIPIRELQRRMDAAEFASWAAFQTIEPIRDARGDFNTALIAQTIANVNRGKGQRPYTIEDFTPRYIVNKQTPDEMRAAFKRLADERDGGGA